MASLNGRTLLLIGASGGIGGALLEVVKQQRADLPFDHIIATFNTSAPKHLHEQLDNLTIEWRKIDITDEAAIAQTCAEINNITWFVNCAGLLHTVERRPEKSVRHIDTDFLLENFATNAQASLLFAKHLRSKFGKGEDTLFTCVSAKVGSISDNRLGGWYSYRISKAALNMALKCLAIEWQHALPRMRVAAYHPGTTDSELSRPFQRNVPAEQLQDQETSARHFLACLRQLHQFPTGQFFSWNGQTIAW